MSSSAPDQVVRLLFEARAAGDVRRVHALLDPEVRARFGYLVRESIDGMRVELDAHRIEREGADSVLVAGRVRIIDGGSLTDSPVTWRFVVRHGRVVDVLRVQSPPGRLRRVA